VRSRPPVVRSGQPAQNFFVVLDGQINLVLYSKTGEEKIVDIIAPGQSFAEAVMFMQAPGYPVSAVANGPFEGRPISSREYMAILRESPETCLRMLGHLSQRLHMLIRDIEYLTLRKRHPPPGATDRWANSRRRDGPSRDHAARVAAGARFTAVDETRDSFENPATSC